jgi:multiple sugar transport system substrate-binding protein
VVVSGIATGKVMPGHGGFARIQQAVRAGLDTVWTPQANIPAAMQSICTQITPLLQN